MIFANKSNNFTEIDALILYLIRLFNPFPLLSFPLVHHFCYIMAVDTKDSFDHTYRLTAH